MLRALFTYIEIAAFSTNLAQIFKSERSAFFLG